MRGRISYIAKRHGKAINKYMQSYAVNKPRKFIMYLDANNLSGCAINIFPMVDLNGEIKKKLIFINWFINCIDGYILEVDLELLDEFNDMHND